MRFIHTSDWHIGQTFHGYDRQKEHIYFLDWLKNTIVEQQADVLLIAGDVFDSPNPSAESQKIFYRFLREINNENPDLRVIIIAGNHDSAGRLEAPNPLLEEMNITIKGSIKRNPDGEIDYEHLLVPLYHKEKIEAYCICLPYLRHGDYPESENYTSGIKKLIESVSAHLENGIPVILMAHLYVSGAEISENDFSERIIIGGIESITSEAFTHEKIIYTALGHLHKAQRVNKKEHICYAGSPLPMSFTEKNYTQGINCFEIQNNEIVSSERLEFKPPVPLMSIPDEPKVLEEILTGIAALPDGEVNENSPFLEIKVLVKEPEPTLKYKLEEALKNKSVRLASFKVCYSQNKPGKTFTFEELKSIDPVEMAEDIFTRQYGEKMPDKIKNLLIHLIERLEK